MAVQDVKYNNNSLQVSTPASTIILTENILYENIAEKQLFLKDDLIRDGFTFLNDRYSQRIITLKGWLISDTAANLRTHIDTVKGYFEPNDQNLDIETYGGSSVYRRWKCSCQNFECREEHWMTTQKPYIAEFLCKPFSTATSSSSYSMPNKTTTPYTDTIAISGSYGPKPIIAFTINSETNMTAIRFTNTTTLDWIEVARSFTAAEVLTIDCDAETVKVGATNVDFAGVFPRFITGDNAISISITDSGAFNYSCLVSYFLTYL